MRLARPTGLGPALNILGEPLAPSPGMSYIESARCARGHIGWRLRSPDLKGLRRDAAQSLRDSVLPRPAVDAGFLVAAQSSSEIFRLNCVASAHQTGLSDDPRDLRAGGNAALRTSSKTATALADPSSTIARIAGRTRSSIQSRGATPRKRKRKSSGPIGNADRSGRSVASSA